MMKCTLCQGSNILGLRQQLQVEESSRQSEISKVQLESALKSRNTPQRDRTSPLPFTLLEEKKKWTEHFRRSESSRLHIPLLLSTAAEFFVRETFLSPLLCSSVSPLSLSFTVQLQPSQVSQRVMGWEMEGEGREREGWNISRPVSLSIRQNTHRTETRAEQRK